MSALSASLNFTPSALKSKSLGSRAFKVTVNPQNGTTFQGLQKVSFQLPSMSRSYFDLKTAYIRGQIKMVNATDTSVDFLDTNIYSIIDRLEVSVANQVIDNIPNYNVLLAAMRSMSNSVLNSNIVAYDMLLNGGDPANPNLSQPIGCTGDGIREFAFPLPSIGLLGVDKFLPADVTENITITLHLADYRDAILQGNTTASTNYELTEMELVIPRAVELTAESQALLDSSVGAAGYVMDYEAVESTTFSKTNTTLQVNQTLGTRVSALNRMLVVMRDSTNLQDAAQLSISNRSHHNLSEASVFIAGQQFPNIPLKHSTSNPCQVLTELLQFEGGFGDNQLSSNLNIPLTIDFNELDVMNTGDADGVVIAHLQKAICGTLGANNDNLKFATVGTNAADQAFTHLRPAKAAHAAAANSANVAFGRVTNFGIENGKQPTNYTKAQGLTRSIAQTSVGTFCLGFNLATFNNDNLYNNISTIGANVSLNLKFSGSATANSTINVYSFYHQIVVLDPVTRQYRIESM